MRWLLCVSLVLSTGCRSHFPDLCKGEGPDTYVEIGSGGSEAFAPYGHGDSESLGQDDSGAYGFVIEAVAEGLDFSRDISLIYVMTVGGYETQDFASIKRMSCVDGAFGFTNFFVDAPTNLEEEIAELEGVPLTARLTLIDKDDRKVSTGDLELFVELAE